MSEKQFLSKKEIALSFLRMAATGDVESAYARFVADNFIHHNQYFAGDRDSLMRAMIDAHMANPNKDFEVYHAIESGEIVAVHSRVIRQNSDQLDVAVVHIMRIANDKIVEMWDVGQLINKESPNENGMF